MAHVTLRARESDFIVAAVPMLLDSGADVSLLPRSAVASLIDGRDDLPHYELAGFDGHVSLAPAVTLELEFLVKSFRGRFLIIDDAIGILGRNVMNSFALAFNGPQLTWNVMA
ncbi:MAG TPA: retropepsin-like aspartic protease [Lacipirellulaceae bacterium]|nr:retropepsin-like aspartic protease [Lacipirellulaceae bacterium]